MSETTEAPRRLRAADVIATLEEALANVTTRSAEPYVSVEFTRNAKGETQISTKVSAPGGVDADEVGRIAAMTYATAVEIYEQGCARYPAASGLVRNDGKEAK